MNKMENSLLRKMLQEAHMEMKKKIDDNKIAENLEISTDETNNKYSINTARFDAYNSQNKLQPK